MDGVNMWMGGYLETEIVWYLFQYRDITKYCLERIEIFILLRLEASFALG